MIIPDTSVWVDYFAERKTSQTALLALHFARQEIMTGDLIITEVLQGIREEEKYRRIKRVLCSLKYVRFTRKPLAIRAADNYRFLRQRGITVRKTIDVIIGTWCIANDFPLLHNDHDFDPMEQYLGLKVVR
jgi:predicted nucleic acid-binding protein